MRIQGAFLHAVLGLSGITAPTLQARKLGLGCGRGGPGSRRKVESVFSDCQIRCSVWGDGSPHKNTQVLVEGEGTAHSQQVPASEGTESEQ